MLQKSGKRNNMKDQEILNTIAYLLEFLDADSGGDMIEDLTSLMDDDMEEADENALMPTALNDGELQKAWKSILNDEAGYFAEQDIEFTEKIINMGEKALVQDKKGYLYETVLKTDSKNIYFTNPAKLVKAIGEDVADSSSDNESDEEASEDVNDVDVDVDVDAKSSPYILKSISQTDDEYRVGNYIVVFGGRDLEGKFSERTNPDGSKGEYFAPDTEFKSSWTQMGRLPLDWEHGFRIDVEHGGPDKDELLGYVDWKTSRVDEVGVWVERVLDRSSKYVRALIPLIKAKVIGTSSMPVQGKVKKSADGKIEKWPLMRDTLTTIPMEPRLHPKVAEYMKSLTDSSDAELKSFGEAIAERINLIVEAQELQK